MFGCFVGDNEYVNSLEYHLQCCKSKSVGVHRCYWCTGCDKDGDEDGGKDGDKDDSLYGDCDITQLIGLSGKISADFP